MEDHLNSNVDPSVPLSVYQVTHSGGWSLVSSQTSTIAGIIPGTRDSERIIQSEHRLEVRLQEDLPQYRHHKVVGNTVSLVSPLTSLSSMGVDLETGPVSALDNKLAEDSNKVSESIAEKTAKLHRLLGDSDKEKGFHLG